MGRFLYVVLVGALLARPALADDLVAAIYARPMAGLMAASENHVACASDEEEDAVFWEELLRQPALRRSVLEELARQDKAAAAELETMLANVSAAPSNVSVSALQLWGWHRPHWGWHPHHGWGGWHPHHGWGRGHHGWHRRLRGASADENGTRLQPSATGCEVSAKPECCNAEGYGEMAPEAVDAIATALNLSSSPTRSFFDLGSGVGRLVLHMAVKGYARAATGVELNSGRHKLGVDLAKKVLPRDFPFTDSRLPSSDDIPSSGVTLLQGDMLLANISSASIVYLNPPCLPCDVQRALVDKIVKQSAAEYVLSTLPLNGLVESGDYVEARTEVLKPMTGYTWDLPIVVYRRDFK